jgi:3-isopropylmalate dehydrogenase
MSAARVVILPGDGIGPEIMRCALEVLDAVVPGRLDFEQHAFGGAAIDAHGTALTEETLAACRGADAVLLAAVGGPKWDTTDPGAPRPEQGLLALRQGLELFANLRPVRPVPALYDASPLRRAVIERTDLLVVRELTGGIYFGAKTRTDSRASDLCAYSRPEIERIARVAFRAARSRVSSVDKANVLETSRLWREVVRELHGREFPNIELEHVLVDTAAMRLVAAPRHFDVILTENMFGDPLRRGGDADRLDRALTKRVAGRIAARAVRARARLRARHRRHRHGKSAGHDPLRRAHAAPRARS